MEVRIIIEQPVVRNIRPVEEHKERECVKPLDARCQARKPDQKERGWRR